jgi:hypothetical protein
LVNTGIITNNSVGTFTNNGTIENHGHITNSGVGTFINYGTITIYNLHIFINGGTLNNSGIITNNSGANFVNSGTVLHPSTLNNFGTFTNDGIVTNSNIYSTINNKGTITNNNSVINSGIITNQCGAVYSRNPPVGNPLNNISCIVDSDGDGISDSSDNCLTQAETINGYQDTDGCPDVVSTNTDSPTDTDKDGIPDNLDKCPKEAETINDYQDTDGCPDTISPTATDTDKDGIPDNLDKCPKEAETINGYLDTDGCPDTVSTGTGSTSTTLRSSTNSPVYGQSVTFTATVLASSGSGIPTGTVTFVIDGIAKSFVKIGTGDVILSLSTLSVGSHTITATYSGDANYASSASTITTISVWNDTDIVHLPASDTEQCKKGYSYNSSKQACVENKIPGWIKNTMQWYLDGSISEDEMISAIQFLVKEGLIKLN